MKKQMFLVSSIFCIILFIFVIQKNEENKYVHTDAYEYVIGVSVPNIAEPWINNMIQDIQKKLNEKYTNINIILHEAAFNSQKQVEDIEQLKNNGIDLLVVVPDGSVQVDDQINKVLENIPVIKVGNMSNSKCTCMIRYDDIQIGEIAGEYILNNLYSLGQKLVVMTGKKDSTMSQLRKKGFLEAVRGKIPKEDITFLEAEWSCGIADNKMKEYLLLNTKLDIVFAFNDEMAYGAYKATADWRLSGIQFVGVDGFKGKDGGQELVKRKVLCATVVNPNLGIKVIDTVDEILKEKNVKQDILIQGAYIME